MSSSNTNTAVIIEYPEWDTTEVKYMPPKINDRGGKSISVISTQSKRALAISTAAMTTWGISDFCNEEGESDGKFKLALQFPSEQYKTPETEEFLTKMKAFENQAIDDAVKNSELWWGKKKSRELVEDSFFPYLKYPKDEKKNLDYSKPPSMKPKVPFYSGEWKTRIFDMDYKKVFPNPATPDATPVDYVPKGSQVVCGLKCTGVWIGGKGWGLTWQVEQLIVKPRVVQRVDNDICHLRVSDKDRNNMVKATPKVEVEVEEEIEVPPRPVGLSREVSSGIQSAPAPTPTSTEVPDSDDEKEPETEVEVETTEEVVVQEEPEPEPVQEEEKPAPVPVKKVIKKVAPPSDAVLEEKTAPPPVKKVVKKKVV